METMPECLGTVAVSGRLGGGRLCSEAQGQCPVQEQLFVSSGPALRGLRVRLDQQVPWGCSTTRPLYTVPGC